MKKLCCIVLSICMIAGLGFSQAFAANVQKVTAELRPDYTIIIDGVERTFYSASGEEAQPMYYNGTSYLPLRAIGELMGKNVNWDQSTLTVTIAGPRQTTTTAGTPDTNALVERVSVEIRPDFTIVIDGTARTFKDANGAVVYPILYDGITYLPIRAIGEIMGKTVDWNQSTSTVTLSGGTAVTDADTFNPSGQSGTTTNPTQPTTPSNTVVPPSTGDIGSERAKEIALSHASVNSSDAKFVYVKQDYENGRKVYEVEFYTSANVEYDYEIDASTGQVVSFDYDAEYYTPVNQNQSGTQITEAKAKEIALSKVAGATASNIVEFKLDYDDGRIKYEGKIIYNTMEYEFEIDAYTGTVLEWDAESIYD